MPPHIVGKSSIIAFVADEQGYKYTMLGITVIITSLGIFLLSTLYYRQLGIANTVQIGTVVLAGVIAYLIFWLQLFSNFQTEQRKKTALLTALLTELEQHAQLLYSIRDAYVTGPQLKQFLRNVRGDQEIPDEDKQRILACFRRIRQDSICDSRDTILAAFDKLDAYRDEKTASNDPKEERTGYIIQNFPIFRQTFSYEDNLTFFVIQNTTGRTYEDQRLLRALGEYHWYANIMSYCFKILTEWHYPQQNGADASWYLNAATSKVQYSKAALQKIRAILDCVIAEGVEIPPSHEYLLRLYHERADLATA